MTNSSCTFCMKVPQLSRSQRKADHGQPLVTCPGHSPATTASILLEAVYHPLLRVGETRSMPRIKGPVSPG